MTFGPYLLESPRSRFGRWAAAAVVVGAVHAAGAALALMQWPAETSQDAAGSVMMELAPLVALTPIDSPDVAHGPLVQEALLTPQASKRAIEEIPKDIPLLEPSPAPEPEVALPTPRPQEKDEPKKEDAKEAVPEKQNAEQASAAPLTTAPPRVEAEPARSSASAPGRSASAAQIQASWQKALIDQLNRHKRYPDAARNSRAQGVVVVAFRLDRSGQLMASRVTKTSGSRALDEEALAVLQRASPLPAPPEQIAGPMLDLVLPIQFRIK